MGGILTTIAQFTVLGYSFVVGGVGFLNSRREGSKIPLYIGIAGCVFLLVSFIISWFDITTGLGLGFGASAIASIYYGVRYQSTKEFYPHLAMFGLSIIAAILILLGLIVAVVD
eukprot:TRINITY_DN4130_c0_g1_i1.p1 TRINITY_DN4130_c0_g1~~TRINITY_DN4130_c0_g1_i1.p1  ORF type:complete len:114 (-),score=21.14 TRINITY_DN4130_c0_g1_i1:136-477(-)